jgi:hypothetical protein
MLPRLYRATLQCTRSSPAAGVCTLLCRVTVIVFLAAAGIYGRTVHCRDIYGDARAIQKALNSGDTVTLNGTCQLGDRTLTFGSNVTINGTATLSYTGSGYAMLSSGNNNTVAGLTFNDGGLDLNANSGADKSGWQSGWTVTNNTFKNIISGANALNVENIIGNGNHTTFSNNTFTNIWPGGYPAKPSGPGASHAIFIKNGLDNILIDSNVCNEIAGNCIKGFTGGFPSASLQYVAHNVVISNNTITLNNRIGIEFNGVGCFGPCNYDWQSYPDVVVKGNYWHTPPQPVGDVYAFSLNFGAGTAGGYYNNSAIVDVTNCGFRPGIGIENDMQGATLQGNVVTSLDQSPCDPPEWAAFEVHGFSHSDGHTNHIQNNVYCGPRLSFGRNYDSSEGQPDTEPYVFTGEAAINSNSCPTTSGIVLAFTSANNQSFPNGGNGTWKATVVSNLSIRNVSFYVDGSISPVAMQEIQDVNNDFSNDRKWHYHVTFNTSSIASGNHTITAKVTDVAGFTQSLTQSFTVGKPKVTERSFREELKNRTRITKVTPTSTLHSYGTTKTHVI